MNNIDHHHNVVKNSLAQFIKKNIPGANLKNVLDDIVLQYVISILEEASEDENFDVEAFQEMMSAYFSDFAKINPALIYTWIFELESQLSKLNEPKECKDLQTNFASFNLTDMIPEEKLRGRQPNQASGPVNTLFENNVQIKRIQHLSETSDGSCSSDSNYDLFLEEYDRMQEMFPESTSTEIKYCLSIANGDVESARQIITHRQESGQSFHNTSRNSNKHSDKKVDEKELKNRIIERYSYIDQSDTSREHRPVIPKVEPKKMIRYRDNKIVSLRGERYTESREDDHELRKPKKVLPTMSNEISYEEICPVTNEVLGISNGFENNSIIVTYSPKIVFEIQVTNRKQLRSWITSDSLSCKVVFDTTKQQYVGVFSSHYIRFWNEDANDINILKKHKISKRIIDILNININEKDKILIIYEDGWCESLQSALISNNKDNQKEKFPITNVHKKPKNIKFTDGLLSFTKIEENICTFFYTQLDEDTLRPISDFKSLKLVRTGQDVSLKGLTVILGKNSHNPSLVTIWSDNRIFKLPLNSSDKFKTVGSLHSMLDSLNSKREMVIAGISEEYIAIYGCKQKNDGALFVLYNMKYKVIQSKVAFKVFLPDFSGMWLVKNNVFFKLAKNLTMIKFQRTKTQLCNMIGSQRESMSSSGIEKEMISEDIRYEENIEFDEDQSLIIDKEIKNYTPNMKSSQNITKNKKDDSDELNMKLNRFYFEELSVDVFKRSVNGRYPVITLHPTLTENIEEKSLLSTTEKLFSFINEFENMGFSEIEISNKIIPLIINANRQVDTCLLMRLLLKMQSHLSEEMIVRILKHLFLHPQSMKSPEEINQQTEMLNILFQCSYNDFTIHGYLRKIIPLSETISIMDFSYDVITNSCSKGSFDVSQFGGTQFDTNIFKWLLILLDSYYQHLLLSYDKNLYDKLKKWFILVEKEMKTLFELSELKGNVEKIVSCQTLQSSKKYNQLCTIEQLNLY
ncbi:CLUMA_CG012673, isoform A [Clunio marinus]|uniref:CLUMA_CG012673, isoform A n=1 Tax=Clunio marinus TaxID=568069 RepID=A0A1J1IGA6_9DIPT|nr:CLUMA_CG012673, isoform A [Clunio marinus]